MGPCWTPLKPPGSRSCNGGQEHRYQQNLVDRRIAIVTLGHAQWPVLRRHVDRVVIAVDAAVPGSYTEVDIPLR